MFLLLATGNTLLDSPKPKALLDFSGRSLLSELVSCLGKQVVILTCQQYFKQFEYWAVGAGFDLDRLICTGQVTHESPAETIIESLCLFVQLFGTEHASLSILSADFLPVPLLQEKWTNDENDCGILAKSDGTPILGIQFNVNGIKKLEQQLHSLIEQTNNGKNSQ
jgi:hypothetical protein